MFHGSKAARRRRDGDAIEDHVGELLERELAGVAVVLHDVRIPGTGATIDHVVVAPSGIWVVDTRGREELEVELELSRENATSVDEVGRHVDVVASAVGSRMTEFPIWAALCFDVDHWGGDPRAFWADGVLVTFPGDLVERIRAAGPLDEDTVGWIAARLALDPPA
jgi:hypothetical protein